MAKVDRFFETRCVCGRNPTVLYVGKFQMARKAIYRSVGNRKASSTSKIKRPKFDPKACCFRNTFQLLMYKRSEGRRLCCSSCNHRHLKNLRVFLKFFEDFMCSWRGLSPAPFLHPNDALEMNSCKSVVSSR